MSSLCVYPVRSPELPNKVLSHVEDISVTLAEFGVRFERRPAPAGLRPGATEAQVLDASRAELDALMGEFSCTGFDVLSLDRYHPQKTEWRARTLDEYQRDEAEVCFFAAGRGVFWLHIEEYVYAVLCEKSDLLLIPAGIKHWFDMGDEPHLVAIRLFNNPKGWTAELTGADISQRFSYLDI